LPRAAVSMVPFAWGNEFAPPSRMMANTWQGEFPWQNLKLDGYEGTSPVGSFPPNGYGLCDMIDNVWGWTSDVYTVGHVDGRDKPRCSPGNSRMTGSEDGSSHHTPGSHIPRRVTKGGSHLCAPNYCLR